MMESTKTIDISNTLNSILKKSAQPKAGVNVTSIINKIVGESGVGKFNPEILTKLSQDTGVDVTRQDIKRLNSWDDSILQASRKKGVNANLIKGILYAESGINVVSEKTPLVSTANAQSIAQTYPEIIERINKSVNENYTLEELKHNPQRAAEYVADYIKVVGKERGTKNVDEQIISYNASPRVLAAFRENKMNDVPAETINYLKKVKTLYTLFNNQTLPSNNVPADFDQKLDNKFEENKAAEVGLVDGVKPFTPELYEAKQDNIRPFIQEVQTPEGDKTVINVKGLEAKTALDNEVKDDEAIIANAQKLNLPPAFLKQAVDFNKSLIPIQEDKNGVESYFFGTLASFNEGLSTVFETVDQAASLVAQATGFQWKNPLFKDIAQSLKKVGKESGWVEPETIVGDVAGSIGSFAPDILMTYLMPEMKLTQMAKLTRGMVTTVPKFPAWLGAKTGLQMYNQSQKPSDLIVGAAKGFTEGLTYHALGVLGNEAGMLAKSFGAGQVASTVTSGIANGVLFGGHSVIADPEIWNRGDINWEKAKKSFWTNFGVGLSFHGKKIGEEVLNLNGINSSLTRKAYLAYWTSNKDMIQTGIESPKTQRELRKESNKYWRNATLAESVAERNQNLLAKAAVDNVILLRPIADMVAKNPKKFRETITNDKRLNDQQKKYFLDKIDETVEAYKINEEKATSDGRIQKDYSAEGRPTSKKNIERIVEQADSEQELKVIKYPEEDLDLKKAIAERRKAIKLQEKETAKAESRKRLAEKKTEISDIQPTKLLTEKESLPKVETVKKEEYTEESIKQAIKEGKKIPLEVKKQFPKLFIEEAKKVGEQEIAKEEKGLPKSETVKEKKIENINPIYDERVDLDKEGDLTDTAFEKITNHLKKTITDVSEEFKVPLEPLLEHFDINKKGEYFSSRKPILEVGKSEDYNDLINTVKKIGLKLNKGKEEEVIKSINEHSNELLNALERGDKTFMPHEAIGKVYSALMEINNRYRKGLEQKTSEISAEVKQNISKVTDLKEKAKEAKSKVKKEKFEKEKEKVLEADDKLKYIDENIAEITKQLSEKGKLEIKGPCPI